MKSVVLALVLAVAALVATADPLATSFVGQCKERPIVNVPVGMRQSNWLSAPMRMPNGKMERSGCCCWASLCNAEQFLNRPDLVRKIRSTQSGGEDSESLARKMAAMGIPFSMTVGQNDVEFLKKAIAGRRGVMVQIDEDTQAENKKQLEETGVDETHMVLLTYIDDFSVCILDCNHPKLNRWITLKYFLSIWEPPGSWAVCPLGTPVPPLAAKLSTK